jgi:hypothetical protein
VTSAGIIVVKDGIVKSLSPLSGHYRSSIEVSSPSFLKSAFASLVSSLPAYFSSSHREQG